LGLAAKWTDLSNNLVLFITIGFCGGFTTFSSFALEEYGMIQEGQYLSFALYTISSIIAGVLAVVFGLWLAKLL
jgi:CrcB protein